MKRTYNQQISKNTEQCQVCGLVKGHCICDEKVVINASVEFWLLTHENEFSRTNNTARLIEYAIETTKTFVWSRVEPPKAMIELMSSYDVYLVFSADREPEKKRVKSYVPSNKKTAFLILDGTWKEARKMLRKSDYLRSLPIIAFQPENTTKYDLRRNPDEHHLCTVEVAIELLKLVGDQAQAETLDAYFDVYLNKYHDGKYEHSEVKHD